MSTVLVKDIPHIFAMSLFEEYIYWTDWETKSINRAHKTLGTNKTVLISTLHRPMDIHIYHPYRQPGGETPCPTSCTATRGSSASLRLTILVRTYPSVENHPCQINNGGCSNLCLISPGGGYKCACPTNFYLAADGKQCLSNCTASQASWIPLLFPPTLADKTSNIKYILLSHCSSCVKTISAFRFGGSATPRTTAATARTSPRTVVSADGSPAKIPPCRVVPLVTCRFVLPLQLSSSVDPGSSSVAQASAPTQPTSATETTTAMTTPMRPIAVQHAPVRTDTLLMCRFNLPAFFFGGGTRHPRVPPEPV